MDQANDLPLEILINILQRLSGSDHAAARQTCKRWYAAANISSFVSRRTVTITTKVALKEPITSILQIFEESELPYSNYLFKELEMSNKCNKFWDNAGKNIRRLTFSLCETSEKPDLCSDLQVLCKCPNLNTLKIELCSKLLMLGLLMDLRDTPSVNNLKTLSLAHNTYLSNAIFKDFIKAAPNLQDLDLSFCNVSFDVGRDRLYTAPESALDFQFIIVFIVQRAQSFKRLSISSTQIDDEALKCLSEVENLNLEILEVQNCHKITHAGILALTSFHKTLRVLDIGKCFRVRDQSLISICHNLKNLEELNIQSISVRDLSIIEVIKLKKLRALNISECDMVTSNGITNGICLNVNRTLNDLDISSLDLVELCIMNMSEKFPELRKFNVSRCVNAVTDASIKAIFKNQKWLRSLKLAGCRLISDEGLTGMSEFDDIFSLARLKGLIDLDLSGCNQITDVSLKYAFHLKELVSLDLSECHQITQAGLEFMVLNCPSIEKLKVMFCSQINDEGVATIVKGLRRLKDLQLEGCSKLTDKSLEHIRTHCECLSRLNVANCKNLSAEEAHSLLSHIKTLRAVHTAGRDLQLPRQIRYSFLGCRFNML